MIWTTCGMPSATPTGTATAGRPSALTAIGDLWEQVAARFAAAAQAGNPADLLETATKPMHDIADREQQFWERLAALSSA